ncbi:hypothetical protein VNO80_22362 [Phaseolus coccineus]|uniref:BHLH domain-containing protein n=1 Tax=Phaseolus coccineus TaxID=3886 RepID=A0AAN9QYN0_PHACN
MDGVYALPEAPRTDFLRSLLQSFGCTYVSMWQYHSNSFNRLFFFDGLYNLPNNQPSSSLGTEAERLFRQYRALTFDVSHECVPGVAFRKQLPYIQLKLLDLLPLASTQIQKQFFLMAVFMGCKMGEIELGFSNISQADIETSLKNLFPEDFYLRSQSIHQNPHSSSSSSSFISISTDTSNQHSSLSLNIPGTSHCNFPEALGVAPTQPTPHQQTIPPLSQLIPFPSYLPTPEAEHEQIVRTLIQVMSSTSQPHQTQPILPHNSAIHPAAADFTRHRPDIINPNIKPHMESNSSRQNLHNTSFPLFKNFNSMTMRECNPIEATHPTSSQKYYHTISERKRREKLSECFQELSALLYPETKKSKATILKAAKETIISLMADIEKLNNMRKQQLITNLSSEGSSSRDENKGRFSDERLNVRVWHVSESSSPDEQMVELQVTVREQSYHVDVLITIMEFLERVQNVTLISTNTNLHITEGATTIHELTFRLRIIEGNEWDERAFEEAIRRLVSDLIQCQVHQNKST